MEIQNKNVKRKMSEEELTDMLKHCFGNAESAYDQFMKRVLGELMNDLDDDKEECEETDGFDPEFIFDGRAFDGSECNPATVAVNQGFDTSYTYDVTPAWFQIPKHPTDEDIVNLKYKAVSEFCEFMTALDEFMHEKTWKNRHHVLHEIGDTVTAMTGVAVALGASSDEITDVCEGIHLKNKLRRYHIPRWDKDEDADGADQENE